VLFLAYLARIVALLRGLAKQAKYPSPRNKFQSGFFGFNSSRSKKPKLDYSKEDVTSYLLKKKLRLQRDNLQSSSVFFISDSLVLYFFKAIFKKISFRPLTPRIDLFLRQVRWDFYGPRARASTSNQKATTYNYFLAGLSSIWSGVRY
jgi:hypothetical protein